MLILGQILLYLSLQMSQAHEKIKILGSPAVKKSVLFHLVLLIVSDHRNLCVG